MKMLLKFVECVILRLTRTGPRLFDVFVKSVNAACATGGYINLGSYLLILTSMGSTVCLR